MSFSEKRNLKKSSGGRQSSNDCSFAAMFGTEVGQEASDVFAVDFIEGDFASVFAFEIFLEGF